MMRKRLGVLGWPLLIVGLVLILGSLYSMTICHLGASLVGIAAGAALVWWAWNTGAVTISCPACRADVDTAMKSTIATCRKCGHRIELRPV